MAGISTKTELKEIVHDLKKPLEKILYSCELEEFENEMHKAFDVAKSNCSGFVESGEINENTTFSNVDVLVLVLKQINKSKKSAIFKEKDAAEEFSKHFMKLLEENKAIKNTFSLVDFVEAIAKFMGFELKSLDNALAKSQKKGKEGVRSNLTKKSRLSCLISLIVHAVLSIDQLMHLAEHSEEAPLQMALISMIKELVIASKFPELKEYKDVCLLDDQDMNAFTEIAFNCLKSINHVMEWMCHKVDCKETDASLKSSIKFVLKRCVNDLSFIVFQHIGKHSWTSTETSVEAQNLLKFLCKLTNSKNSQTILSGTENMQRNMDALEEYDTTMMFPHGISGLLLENVRSKFFNGGWKRDPSLVHIIVHVTTNIKYPNLKPHIKILVPVFLEVVEDYKTENQVLGMESLRYLIENVNASDLNLYNHAALIYQVLFKLLYGTKPVTLIVLLPCMQKVLHILEPFAERLDSRLSSKWDETIEKLITNLEYENNNEVREILVSNLPSFMKAMGINCAKHLQSIIRATSFCLEVYDNKDGRIRQHGLDVLRTLVVTCWPIIWRYIGVIMKIMLKTIIDISVQGSVVEDEARASIKEKSKEVLILISDCCGAKTVIEYIENVADAEIGESFIGVQEFLEDAKRDIEMNES